MLSKITLTPVHLTLAQTAEHQAAIQNAQAAHHANGSVQSPTLSPTPSQTSLHPPHSPGPSGPFDHHTGHSEIHQISSSNEYNLKVQSLQTLIMVLRSLVSWSQQGIAATIASTAAQDETSLHTPDESPRSTTPNPGAGSRSTSQNEINHRGGYLVDDPEQFEALKYRKTALQDAITKFNFKPKKVSVFCFVTKFRESKLFFVIISSKLRIQQKLRNFLYQLKD